jgi:site-specific recombinase XerD
MDKKIAMSLVTHVGKAWILVKFEQDTALNKRMRGVPGSRWTKTYKGWLVPDTAENREKCGIAQARAVSPEPVSRKPAESKQAAPYHRPSQGQPPSSPAQRLPRLCKENQQALERFLQELTLKAYSPSTIRTYRNELLQLLQLLKDKPASELTPDDLRRYMAYAMEKEGIKENTAHSRLNALKFYYEQVLKKEKFFWEVPRPKKQQQLPRFFNQDEIAAIINATKNLKHKAMLMLSYSCGLRVSEVVAMKAGNIDSKRMCVLIEQAKGKKDRIAALSPVLLVVLREYWKTYKPLRNGYLFEGQNPGEPYSTRSLQLVLDAAKHKAGILKPGSVHALRHSFATHLLDKGTDVTMIMKLLGHNDLKTTLRYLHVTNRDMLQLISPLDDLKLK